MSRRPFSFAERLLGVECFFCGVHLRERKKVENHHKNGNRKDNRRENKVWVCKECHAKVSLTQKKGRPVIKSENPTRIQLAESRGELVCEKKNGVGVGASCATEALKECVDYSEGGPHMQVNDLAEMPWRKYCEALIRLEGRVRKKRCLNAGAEAVGISQATAYRYYGKWVSEEGPCFEFKSEDNKWWVKWRRVPADLITSSAEPLLEPTSIGEALKESVS